jgi:hypothetical protein
MKVSSLVIFMVCVSLRLARLLTIRGIHMLQQKRASVLLIVLFAT